MAIVLDFADSEATSLRVQADALVLRLAAAQVERDGESGYLLGLEAHFEGARWQGDPAACFGRIRSAHLTAGQQSARLVLPFREVTVAADFLFHNGEQLQVQAEALRIDPASARFVASYAC